MQHVIRDYTKPQPSLVQAFAKLSSATIYEAAGQRGMVDPSITPIYDGARVCGTAITVKCHVGDNLMLHKAVTVAGPGDVIVATIGNHVEAGAWGEVLTVAAMARGIAGLVIDGAVRDVQATEEHGFPVFSRGIAIGATMKRNIGTINHPIVCGGIFVEPGDIVVGDRDGVVIVPQARAESIRNTSFEREEKEAHMMEQLRSGSTTLDLLNLEPILKQLGLTDDGSEFKGAS